MLHQRGARSALITGAANGIGAAIAKRLAGTGLVVGLVDKDEEGLLLTVEAIEEAGGRAVAFVADVANSESLMAAVDDLGARVGPFTILVNNAGMARDASILNMSLEDWDAVQDVHLRCSFILARAVVPSMASAGWGRIVQISSTSALGHSDRVNYGAAKAGMHGFVRSLAVELGPMGITANAVAPGLILTRMTAATAARRGLTVKDHLADAARCIPVGRAGRPEDVAAAVSYFTSEEAGFVSGQVLFVAGGVLR